MGAHRNRENFGDCEDYPTTLCQWVRSFRIKRMQMNRKLRGNLRVKAVLNKALENAECELRRKQRDRLCRWTTVFQAKLDECYDISNFMKDRLTNEGELGADEQRDTINDLWKSELSDLDTFMRSLSSSSSSNNRNCNENAPTTNAYQNDDCSTNMQSDKCNALQHHQQQSIAVVS